MSVDGPESASVQPCSSARASQTQLDTCGVRFSGESIVYRDDPLEES